MIFSVYVLRDDPDYVIFDRQLSDPPIGRAGEYDCAGVFHCGGESADIRRTFEDEFHLYCMTDTGFRVSAYSLLTNDFTDRDKDEVSLKAGVKRLWPNPHTNCYNRTWYKTIL